MMETGPWEFLARVRREQPLVHHLTNWVTIYDCAQVVKALGGSPVMAHAREEVAEMAQAASALVLNVGTLSADFVTSMKLAARAANLRVIPVILDICGAGATAFRDQIGADLLRSVRIEVIKGNASEIASIAGEKVRTKGVDTAEVHRDLPQLAQRLARKYGSTVVVTGPTDIVTDGKETFLVCNGHELMAHVVGTGCMAASVIGAFAAVGSLLTSAAVSALACYGIAGELAAERARGPASFKQELVDALYSLDCDTVTRRAKIERLPSNRPIAKPAQESQPTTASAVAKHRS
jgi:hydroxyethylthiazole kinase